MDILFTPVTKKREAGRNVEFFSTLQFKLPSFDRKTSRSFKSGVGLRLLMR